MRYPEEFLDGLCAAIRQAQKRDAPTLIGIDGPGCSGKSTLADELVERFAGNAVAVGLDAFFTPLSKQSLSFDSTEHLGSGVPHLRWSEIETAVLGSLARGEPAAYRPYLWDEDALGSKVEISASALVIVEGLYALHPNLRDAYAFKVWVDTRRHDRMDRVRSRHGRSSLTEHQARILRLWDDLYVPREQAYIARHRPYDVADVFVLGAGTERANTHQTFAWHHRQ